MSKPFSLIKASKVRWIDDQPYSDLYKKIYFDSQNAFVEKKKTYLDANCLIDRWRSMDAHKSFFCVGEIGFGAGLNFLLTCYFWRLYAPVTKELVYFSCENNPISAIDLERCLNAWPELKPFADALLDQYPILTPGFHYLSFRKERIKLILMIGENEHCLEQMLGSGDSQLDKKLRLSTIDCWYLDKFNLLTEYEFWQDEVYAHMAKLSNEHTTLSVNLSSKNVKNSLQRVGFVVTSIQSVLDKQIICASFRQTNFYRKKKTFWHLPAKESYQEKKAIVIGAGIAGCLVAYALNQRGWHIQLIDAGAKPGTAASANPAAILYPNFSAYQSPLTELMLSSFLYAAKFYRQLHLSSEEAEMAGIIQLITSNKDHNFWLSMQDWLAHYPQLAQPINSDAASNYAGIAITGDAFYIPLSGLINCGKLCQKLIDRKGIEFIANTPIQEIYSYNNRWQVGDFTADVVVIASGAQSNQFTQTKFLPIKLIKGQLTWIKDTPASKLLKIPICAAAHVTPSKNDRHALGATYETLFTDLTTQEVADYRNLDNLRNMPTVLDWSSEVLSNWAGMRAATPDYLPLVGAVPDYDAFLTQFSALKDDANRWLPLIGSYHKGLYMLSALGSRGLTTAPLCSEWLASFINNEANFLPHHLLRAIAPSRFIIQQIVRYKNKLAKG